MPQPQRLFALSQQAVIKHIDPVRKNHLVQEKRRYYFRTATQSIPVSLISEDFEGYVFSKKTLGTFLRYCTIPAQEDSDGRPINYANDVKSKFHDTHFSTIHRFFLKPKFLESFTTSLMYRAKHFWKVAQPELFAAPLLDQAHLHLKDPYHTEEVMAFYGFLLDQAKEHLETFYKSSSKHKKRLELVQNIQKIRGDGNFSTEDITFAMTPIDAQERIIKRFTEDALSQKSEQWLLSDRASFFILELVTYSQWLKRVYRSKLCFEQVHSFLNELHIRLLAMEKQEAILRSSMSEPRDENLLFLLAAHDFRKQYYQIRRPLVKEHYVSLGIPDDYSTLSN